MNTTTSFTQRRRARGGKPLFSADSTPLRGPVLVILFLVAALLAVPSLAQQAPEGNAHPATEAVSADARSLPNPFGPPQASTMTREQKRDFAESVDLTPLEGLAVFHNGRVKVMGTLAGETVRQITGKRRYDEAVQAEGGKVAKARYQPMFTLLDLTIDPQYYLDKPVIHVDYLPLRRALVERSLQDPAARERYLRIGRVSPQMIFQSGSELANQHAFDAGYTEAFSRIDQAIQLWSLSASNMKLIAPAERDHPYIHVSSLPEGSPARRAALELGAAWRTGDAPRVNSAVATLAAELPAINSEFYPGFKRNLEIAYNRANAFEWGLWAYCLSFVTLLIAFGTGRRWVVGMGVGALAVALALHAFGFTSRCLIAERFAIQNQFESMTGLSLFAVLVGTGIMLFRRQWLFGAAAAGVGFLVLTGATQTGIPGVNIEREAAILNTSVLLKYHVTTVLVSYGLISLGFICSLFYLGTHYAAKLRARSEAARAAAYGAAPAMAADALNLDLDQPAGTARTLHDLDRAQLVVLQLAFWTLAVGIMLGAWWADHSWGRWWAFDPKETWALATWIIYLIVIHVRLVSGHNRGLATAWLSVLGFIVMLWTYFGVNLLLPGLHAYA